MRVLIVICLVAISTIAAGQQEYSFTHYFQTNSFYNPASTGSEHTQNIVGLFRKQWLGMEGTPTTGGVIYENELSKYNMGIGGYVFTDKIGATLLTTVTANYAYNLRFDNDLRLAFGIDLGADFITTDYSRLVYWDQNDAVIGNGTVNNILPKVGVGTQLYNDKFYVGLAVPRVLNFNTWDFHSLNLENIPMLVSHYYLSAGYNFELNDQFDLKANTLLKYTNHVTPQADINATCTYNKLIGFGMGYKSLGFASAYLQYTYDQTVMISYAYDMSLNPMREYSRGGTHEIMIKYTLKPKGNKSNSKI